MFSHDAFLIVLMYYTFLSLVMRKIVLAYKATCRKLYEPRHGKTGFLHAYAKTKTQISFTVTAKLISAFVFATWIVQSLFYLNAKSHDSSHLLWLYSPVCVGPGRKPRRRVFFHNEAHMRLFKLISTFCCSLFRWISTIRVSFCTYIPSS